MAIYFKAEYPDGQVVERRDCSLRGLKLNGARPIKLSVYPEFPGSEEIMHAHFAVHPGIGTVVDLSLYPSSEQ